MAATTVTTTQFVLTAARAAHESRNLKDDGERTTAVRALLNATSADERDNVVLDWGAGFLRRSLRESARFFEAHNDQETAEAFWALRDMVEEDGFLDEDAQDDSTDES